MAFGLINQWAKEVAQAALNVPGGLYEVGKQEAGDIGRVAHGDFSFKGNRRIGKSIAQGFWEDIRHPKQRAPFLALDILGLASLGAGTAARGVAVAGDIGRGADAAAVAKTLLRNPPPGERLLRLNPKTGSEAGVNSQQLALDLGDEAPRVVRGFYSKAPLTRGLQKLRDIGQEAAPEKHGLTFQLDEKFGPLAGHQLRIPYVIGSRNALAKHYTDEAGRILRRLELARGAELPEAQLKSIPGEVSDAINQATTTGILYLKGSYALPNLLGQAFLTLTQHHFNPIELAKSSRMSLKLKGGDPDFTGALGRRVGQPGELSDLHETIRGIMGDTIQTALHVGGSHRYNVTRGIATVHSTLGKAYSKLLDSPFRDASFFYEARKAGFHTPEQVRELLTNPAHEDKLVEVARRANRALIDYTRLGKTERQVVRRVIFFYPWTKGATMYAGHFLREHPIQAAVTGQLGVAAQAQARRELGPTPSFLAGVFKTGERTIPGLGRVPLVSNPSSAAILSTPAQVGETLRGVAFGGQTQWGQLSEFLNPLTTLGGELAFRTDPFTGEHISAREGVLGLAKNTGGLLNPESYPLGRFLSRGLGVNIPGAEKPPTAEQRKNFLYPSSPSDERKRFVLGLLTPRPLNPAQARSKYRAEQRDLLSPRDRTIAAHKFFRSQLDELGNKAGVIKGPLPPELKQALNLRARRYVALAEARDQNGGELTAEQRLQVDLRLLVQMGVMTGKQAAGLQQQLHGQPDAVINGIRSQWGAYFGQQLISSYTRQLRAAGVEVPGLPG